jgi:prepilin-type N-terminal cleavage/methylation domain-containing protein
MRKAFTLIELIFSMVIIAIAFSVLPKVLQLATKSATTSLKEEAMYNAVAYAGLIRATAWDENNTEVDDILLVANGASAYDCNTTSGYRVGGFRGSRNCFHTKDASVLGSDDGDLDDVDDFSTIGAQNFNASREYDLNTTVVYVADSFFATTAQSSSTNSKRVTVVVAPRQKRALLGKAMAKLSFTLYNLGQLRVNKRSWE